MTTQLESPQPAGRSRLGTRLVSFTPLWTLIAVSIASPTFSAPLISKPPDIMGIPLGVVGQGLVMLWMLLGVALAWNARSRLVEAFALLLFTFPATMLTLFVPAIILIMLNLG